MVRNKQTKIFFSRIYFGQECIFKKYIYFIKVKIDKKNIYDKY